MKNSVFRLVVVLLLLMLVIPPVNAADEPAAGTSPQLPLYLSIGYAFLGVFISFLIPVVAKFGVRANNARKNNVNLVIRQVIIDIATPYFFTAVLSLLLAFVVVAALYNQDAKIDQWFVPFIAGYTFDATIQKIKN